MRAQARQAGGATYGYTAYGSNDDKLFTGVDKPDPVDPTAKEEYNPYRFNAKRWDNSTGMYDMGFRDYNPGLNRFLTLDSYNGALNDLSLGTDPWTSNRYAFTGGNPISLIELDEHMPDQSGIPCGNHGGAACNPSTPSPTPSPEAGPPVAAPVSAPSPNKSRPTASPTPSPRPGQDINKYFRNCEKIGHQNCQWGKSEVAALYDIFVADYAECASGDATSCAWAFAGSITAGVGKIASAIAKAGRVASKARKIANACRQSFVPGTEVLMADGTRKPIEDVKVGDKVLATDPETGKTEAKPVIALITGEDDKNLVQITVDTDGKKGDQTGLVIATEIHPFWVPALHKWVDAKDLKPGMWLRTAAGTHIQVTAIKKWTAHQRVHNLTIADIHTYYVLAGATPVLVHNSNCAPAETVNNLPEVTAPKPLRTCLRGDHGLQRTHSSGRGPGLRAGCPRVIRRASVVIAAQRIIASLVSGRRS
ncbi:polymorphic toxin-type HINT domain-containing protein [Streptosporangium canum]|uniref:polymorphic toxin-type HINT domain-containing protein n=1 Tax=Streptosporangium canum TaxID=324952 RepID=UPI0037BE0FA1